MKTSLLILSLFFGVVNSCFSQEQVFDSTQPILKIDFQKAFVQDTISLKVNESLIFRDVILTTNTLSDAVDFEVSMIASGNNKIAISYTGRADNKTYYMPKQKLVTQLNKSSIHLAVILNKKTSEYTIDLNMGKYVGLSKSGAELKIVQQDRRFVYD